MAAWLQGFYGAPLHPIVTHHIDREQIDFAVSAD